MKGKLWNTIDHHESLWQIESSTVTLHLEKTERSEWPVLISGPLPDTKGIPAGTPTVPDTPLIDPHSSYILGHYQHILGLSDAALTLFKAAANQNHLEGMLQAAAILSLKLPLTEEDERDARCFLNMAADNYSSPTAMVMLAELGSTDPEQRVKILTVCLTRPCSASLQFKRTY
jgi:hypothetical protein